MLEVFRKYWNRTKISQKADQINYLDIQANSKLGNAKRDHKVFEIASVAYLKNYLELINLKI